MARNPSQNSRAKVDLSFQFSSHTITALRAMPGGSSCPKWNNKMMEDICIHFILDTTTVEISLVILSSWQGKTCGVTRLQFVNQTSCNTRGPLRLVCQHDLCPWTLLWVCAWPCVHSSLGFFNFVWQAVLTEVFCLVLSLWKESWDLEESFISSWIS